MCISPWIYLRGPVQIVACTTESIRIEVYSRTANAKPIARIYVSINSTCPLLDFYPEKLLSLKPNYKVQEKMKKITIAIDGFSSCGKSTMAKDLAKEIGYIYIDSGAMYRAVTLYCIEHNLFGPNGEIKTDELKQDIDKIHISFRLDPVTSLPRTCLNGNDVEERIRTLEVSSKVSPVATLGFVREALVRQQQELGKEKGIVMDGRDIGTTVFPDAELKIFVTASPAIRAQRRYDELRAKGQPASYEDILHNVEERDRIDQSREVSPLRKADDAILLDNSHMTITEQKEWLINQFKRAAQ